MFEILRFMSESPFLTFFLALVIAQCIIGVFKALAYAIRGRKNEPCPRCGYRKKDKNKDKDKTFISIG